jgi:hypothetical protein
MLLKQMIAKLFDVGYVHTPPNCNGSRCGVCCVVCVCVSN